HDEHRQPIQIVPGARLLLESDKPLYQPAQTIHLRALAQRPMDGRPVTGRDARFTVLDPRGNQVFQVSRPLSAFGVAATDFALADEITTGSYRARVEVEGAAPGELALSVERY